MTDRKERMIKMSVSSIVKGVVAGAAAGAVVYAFSNSNAKQRKRVKTNTGKAIRAIGNVVDGISYMMN